MANVLAGLLAWVAIAIAAAALHYALRLERDDDT